MENEVERNLAEGAETKAGGLRFARESGRVDLRIEELASGYEPCFQDSYKAEVWKNVKARYAGEFAGMGTMEVRRWGCVKDDGGKVDWQSAAAEFAKVDGFFENTPSDAETMRWYLNFADPELFGYYMSSLFAQDEIQTLEHPLLGSVCHYLGRNPKKGMETRTIGERSEPTPYLFCNVPYLVGVKTRAVIGGNDVNIYGRNFGWWRSRDSSVLDRLIKVRDEWSSTNIIAMAAPYPSCGCYSKFSIWQMLSTTLVAFEGAVAMSRAKQTEIHTGRWGAGAFGGNEELSLLVQMLAANAVGVRRVVFHAVSEHCYYGALRQLGHCSVAPKSVGEMIQFLESLNYRWGDSDGN